MSTQANATVVSKTAYEGSVIARAIDRAGNNHHLKGHIHEILVKDVKNFANVFKGQTTHLTKSVTANTVDLITMKGGKVVERLQLKDTISQSGVHKLVRQVGAGKYRTTQLIGTDETTELVNAALKKAGLKKRMASSAVSSNTTTSLAQRAGASGSGSLGSAVGQAAKSGGTVGAAVGVGVEVLKGVADLIDGKREAGEVAGAVVKACAKGYAIGAAASAAATASGATVAGALTTIGAGAILTTVATVAAPVTIAIGIGYAVSEVFDWLFD